MSKTEEAPKKKKKLPLPVIIAVVAIAGGGGYFVMGKKSAKKPADTTPQLILGETVDLGEFVTPLSDGKTFLDAEIQVRLEEKGKLNDDAAAGGEGGGKAAPDPLARNAVLTVLKSTDPHAIDTAEGMSTLRQQIAWQINHDIAKLKKFSKTKEAPAADASKDGKKDAPATDPDVFTVIPTKSRKFPDLDCDGGPVHLVMFSKFLPIDYGQG